MLRLSVLAIVLSIGIGPSAAILCHTWCAGDSLPQECHQQLAVPTVEGTNCCDSSATSLTAVLSGESRQEAVPPNQDAGAFQHRVKLPALTVRLSHQHQPRGSNETSLVTVLRI
jgi:hypothetical protein